MPQHTVHLWKRSLNGKLNGLMHQVTWGWRGCVWACECCNIADVISAAEVIISSLKISLPNSVSELLVTSDLDNLPLIRPRCVCCHHFGSSSGLYHVPNCFRLSIDRNGSCKVRAPSIYRELPERKSTSVRERAFTVLLEFNKVQQSQNTS